MTQSLRILFAGSGAFGLPSLRRLIDDGNSIVRVVTQPDRPAGRGRELTPTPIAQYAVERNLPLVRTPNINSESALTDADLMVVIAFGQKINDVAVNRPRLGSINLHASRLPKYRGAAPINWAILNGETITGNSIIRLAQRMDAGAVLAMSEVAIGELETAGELHDRLAEDGAVLLSRTAAALAQGTATETPQDESLATTAPKLSRDSARLDWKRDATDLANQIRGLSPWPGTRVIVCDASGAEVARVRLVRARALDAHEGSRWSPGELTTEGDVQTGQGVVRVIELQPDGKRPMSLADYRRGHPWVAGLALRSID